MWPCEDSSLVLIVPGQRSVSVHAAMSPMSHVQTGEMQSGNDPYGNKRKDSEHFDPAGHLACRRGAGARAGAAAGVGLCVQGGPPFSALRNRTSCTITDTQSKEVFPHDASRDVPYRTNFP